MQRHAGPRARVARRPSLHLEMRLQAIPIAAIDGAQDRFRRIVDLREPSVAELPLQRLRQGRAAIARLALDTSLAYERIRVRAVVTRRARGDEPGGSLIVVARNRRLR